MEDIKILLAIGNTLAYISSCDVDCCRVYMLWASMRQVRFKKRPFLPY